MLSKVCMHDLCKCNVHNRKEIQLNFKNDLFVNISLQL